MTQKPTLTREQIGSWQRCPSFMMQTLPSEGGMSVEQFIELCRGYLAYLDMVPRPIEEAKTDWRLTYAMFDKTEGGWTSGSWDDDENGWFTPFGQISPTHFIPLSALPTPEGE